MDIAQATASLLHRRAAANAAATAANPATHSTPDSDSALRPMSTIGIDKAREHQDAASSAATNSKQPASSTTPSPASSAHSLDSPLAESRRGSKQNKFKFSRQTSLERELLPHLRPTDSTSKKPKRVDGSASTDAQKPESQSDSSSDDEVEQDGWFSLDARLHGVPYMNPPAVISGALYAPPEMQRLILLGNAICLDVLLYCFTVLPLRVAASLFRLMRYPSRRSATQIYATIQGAIVLCAVIAVDQLDVSETAYYFMRSQMNWAKLYSCFQLFSALDILVEQCGRRITGSLVWSVLNRSQRLLMAIVTFIYVFAHASIILVQIASVHVALDQGSELLSLMLSVQLVELKAAMVTSMTRIQLFKTCLTDIAQQFRWLIILFTIYVDKLSRYTPEKMKTSMPLFLQGATVVLAGTMLINCIKHAMYALNNTTWDIKTLYRSFGTLLLQPFEAGKLISDKSKHLSQHFDFVSLPYTVIAVRLFTICVGRSSMPLFVGLGCFAALCAFKFTIRFALRSLSQSIAQRRARQQNALRRLSTTISLVMGLNQAMKHKMDADRDHGILEEETASMVDVDEEPAHLD